MIIKPLVTFWYLGVTNQRLHSFYENFRHQHKFKTSSMRKIVLTSLAGILLAGAAGAQEKKSETIEGNGKIVTRDVSVSSFDALKASGVYELKLSQGNKETVR